MKNIHITSKKLQTSTLDKDIALIYGTMLGDGCLSRVGKHHYFLEICGNIKDDLHFLKKIKSKLEKIRGKRIKIKKRLSLGKLEMSFSDKKTFLLFKNLGFPVGKKGTKVRIPDKFPLNLYKFIVQGYFATDGCLVITNNNGTLYPRIEFSSISKPLLKQILNYLNNIGMKGKLYLSHRYSNHWNDLYRIQFNGKKNLNVFLEKIGFVNTKHLKKYRKWKSAGTVI